MCAVLPRDALCTWLVITSPSSDLNSAIRVSRLVVYSSGLLMLQLHHRPPFKLGLSSYATHTWTYEFMHSCYIDLSFKGMRGNMTRGGGEELLLYSDYKELFKAPSLSARLFSLIINYKIFGSVLVLGKCF